MRSYRFLLKRHYIFLFSLLAVVVVSGYYVFQKQNLFSLERNRIIKTPQDAERLVLKEFKSQQEQVIDGCGKATIQKTVQTVVGYDVTMGYKCSHKPFQYTNTLHVSYDGKTQGLLNGKIQGLLTPTYPPYGTMQ